MMLLLLILSCLMMIVSSFISSSSMNGYVSKIYRGKTLSMVSPLERVTGKSSMDVGILDRYLSLPQNGMIQAEYVFIDAVGKCRSKTRTLSGSKSNVGDLPEWTYDGSSTGQAPGEDSEVIIKPQKIYPDPFRPGNNNIIVLCDTYTPEGKPLPTNTRFNAASIFGTKDSTDAIPWYIIITHHYHHYYYFLSLLSLGLA